MIKIGDIIKLRPSAFEPEFDTYHWQDKYLYEDRFHGVILWFENLVQQECNTGQRGDIANTLFGSSESIVNEIEYGPEGQPFIVYTDRFSIFYAEALEKNEITILSSAGCNQNICKVEKEMINDLEFFEQEYLNGLFNVLERENNKLASYKVGLARMIREGKWKK